MNTRFLPVICFVSLFCLLLAGCKQTPAVSENDLTFTTFETQKKVHLFNDTAKPGCNFKLKIEYPSGYSDEAALKKLQEQIITSYFGEEYTGLEPQQAAEKYKDDYIVSYKELEESYNASGNSEENGGNAWMNYEQTSDSKPVFNKGGFLSYGINIYSYTGGAHGMATYIYQVFNLKEMSQVKLSDIFEDRNLDNIATLIKQALARKTGTNGIAKLEEIGYDVNAIVPTENFFVGDSGITWQYNNYEIGAYTMGSPQVMVDYKDLQIYVKEDSAIKPLIDLLAIKEEN